MSIEEAQEISGIGYWELDFVKDELLWSNQVYKIFAVNPDEFSPTQELFEQFVHPEDLQRMRDTFAKATETKRPYEIQHRIVLKDKSIKYVIEKSNILLDESGAPKKSFGSIQDVTESVESRMQLEASQNKFMAISNQTTEGITVADLEGNYVFVNPAFCSMSGYSEAELLEMTVFDMKAENQDHSSFKNTKEKMEGKPVRVNLRKKDGSEYLTEIIGDIINVDGESLVLGTIRDITEQVKSEELIIRLNRDLESTVKERTAQLKATIQDLSIEVEQRREVEQKLKESLTVKNVLFKEITHRVKNNMQIISSLINLQKSHVDAESSILLEQIAHRIHSMALIHETLYKTNDFREIQFDYYLRSLIKYIRESYPSENIEIDLVATKAVLPLDVGTSLGMTIIELAINSIKHAFPNPDEKSIIQVRFEQPCEKHYKLTVSDNGVGFPEGIDYQKTHSLGLQLVSSLVEQISGEIELKRGNGTQFEITFRL